MDRDRFNIKTKMAGGLYDDRSVLICVSNFVSRMDRGLVEHFDEPAMNRCYRDFCASLESNKCMANRALIGCLYSEGSENRFIVV